MAIMSHARTRARAAATGTGEVAGGPGGGPGGRESDCDLARLSSARGPAASVPGNERPAFKFHWQFRTSVRVQVGRDPGH